MSKVRNKDLCKGMPISTLTRKGQTTIPIQVREYLRLQPGDRLEFSIEGDGQVVLRPATASIEALDGMLDRSGTPPVSLAAMQQAIAAGARRSMGEAQ